MTPHTELSSSPTIDTKKRNDDILSSPKSSSDVANPASSPVHMFMSNLLNDHGPYTIVVDNARSPSSGYRKQNPAVSRSNSIASRRWSSSSSSSSSNDSDRVRLELASPDKPATAPSRHPPASIVLDCNDGSSDSECIQSSQLPLHPSQQRRTSKGEEGFPDWESYVRSDTTPLGNGRKKTSTSYSPSSPKSKREKKDSDLSIALIDTIEKLSVQAALALCRPHQSRTMSTSAPSTRMQTMEVLDEVAELCASPNSGEVMGTKRRQVIPKTA